MQKSKRSGLPETFGMRHDTHFVEFISKKGAAPVVRMISVDRIEPNPRQPRTELGNIEDLTSSIKAKGVLEPIIVRPVGQKYEIIAGERRYVASKNAGLAEIPCIEMSVGDNEAMEISLIENLQRKDLDIFEEADGLKMLIETYSYSHAQVSEKIGKARSTITEIVNISKIPVGVREMCRSAGIDSNRSLLIEVSKLGNEQEMKSLVERIADSGLRRVETRDLTKLFKAKSPDQKKSKRYIFNYAPKTDKTYKIRIEFKKESVSRQEIIKILEDLLSKLKLRG